MILPPEDQTNPESLIKMPTPLDSVIQDVGTVNPCPGDGSVLMTGFLNAQVTPSFLTTSSSCPQPPLPEAGPRPEPAMHTLQLHLLRWCWSCDLRPQGLISEIQPIS